jgi:hypothetical protein
MSNTLIFNARNDIAFTSDHSFYLGFDEQGGSVAYDGSSFGNDFLLIGIDFRRRVLPNGNGGYSIGQNARGISYLKALESGIAPENVWEDKEQPVGDVTTNDYSLSLWVSPLWSEIPGPDDGIICSKCSPYYRTFFQFFLDRYKWSAHALYSNGDYLTNGNTHDLLEGEWSHIVFTVNRTPGGHLVKYYKNGVFINQNFRRTSLGNPKKLSLSNSGVFEIFRSVTAMGNDHLGHHTVDDLYFFSDKLLSPEEALNLYEAMK